MDTELRSTLIIDDIVPEDRQNEFQQNILKAPYHFLHDMSYNNEKYPSYGFTSVFKDPFKGVISPFYELVSVPIINALIEREGLEINDIYFNRAFIQLPLAEGFYKGTNGIHVDLPKEHIACVYYVNDSDGDTVIYEQNIIDTPAGTNNVDLKEHARVTPKKGRLVMFDGRRYHCSSQPKNGYRCIINFDLI